MFHVTGQVLVIVLLGGGLNSAPAPTEVLAAPSVQCDRQSENPCLSFPDLCLAGGGRCVVKGPCEYQCLCPPDGRVGRDCTSTSQSQPGSVVDSLLLFSKDIFLDENHMEKAQAFPKLTPSSNITRPATTLQRAVTTAELVVTSPDLTETTQGIATTALKLTGTIQEIVDTTTGQADSTREFAEPSTRLSVVTQELSRTRSDIIKESGEASEDSTTAENGTITESLTENATRASNISANWLSSPAQTGFRQTMAERPTQEASLAAVGLGLLNLIASAFSRLTNYSSKYYPTSDTNYSSKYYPTSATNYSSKYYPTSDTNYSSKYYPTSDTNYISKYYPVSDTSDGINLTVGVQEKGENSQSNSISGELNKTVGVSTNQTTTATSVSSNTRLLGTLIARLSQVDSQISTLEPSAKIVPEVTFVASYVTSLVPQTTSDSSVSPTTDSFKAKQTSANTRELSTLGSTVKVSRQADQSFKATDRSQESQSETGSKPDMLQTLITDKLQQLFQQLATSLKITTTENFDQVPAQQRKTTETNPTTIDTVQGSNPTPRDASETLLPSNTTFSSSIQQISTTTGASVAETTILSTKSAPTTLTSVAETTPSTTTTRTTSSAATTTVLKTTEEFPTLFKMGDDV